MAKLTFYGAAGTVTGSRFFLELGDSKLLIDCGLFQGTKQNRLRNWDPFPVPSDQIDKILLTHAHIDHTGYLPRVCGQGFRGEIHCTHATSDLCKILLRDSAHIQEEDANWANRKGFSKHKPALPLYTVKDAEKTLGFFRSVNYGESLHLQDDVRVKFKDAGHILGSSFIDMKIGSGDTSQKIVFSGDIGRAAGLILREPTQAFNVDYLVLESTYGNRLHPEGASGEELAEVVNESLDRGGVLLIPAFAVGRTQTILYMLRELEEAGKIPEVPVFVDSPMAIDATDIFKRRIPDQNLSTRIQKLRGKKVFQPRYVNFSRSRNQSKAINNQKKRAIIISASGMATGGRVLHHLVQRLPYKRNTVLFIGYQAHGTRGRTLMEGSDRVRIHGQHVPVRAAVRSLSGFSGHADYNEILAWLMAFNKPPKKTFLVHGEPEAAESLAQKIRATYDWDVEIPEFGQSFSLDVGI